MSQDRRSRREFMNLTGATVAGVVGAPFVGVSAKVQAVQAAVGGGTDPDMIVVNAAVYTVDPRSPRAEAFAVTNGRFSAVGSTADIKALAGKTTQVFDAKGLTIVPGFIDCHNHAGGETLLYDVLVGNPFEVEFVSILSIVGKLKAKAQQVPPGTWVEGYFFDDTKVKDTRGLHKRDLDEVSKDHPVVVRHRGGHTSFYNSQGLRDGRHHQGHARPDGRHLRQGSRRSSSTAGSPTGPWTRCARSARGPPTPPPSRSSAAATASPTSPSSSRATA